MYLTVKQPFGQYDVGDVIVDTVAIAAILGSDLIHSVLAIGNDAMTNVSSGQITGVSTSETIYAFGNLNVSIYAVDPSAPIAGTFVPERSFDGGETWIPVTALDQSIAFTNFPMSTTLTEGEPGVLYRLNCTAFSGGAANYRLSRA